MYVEFSEKSIMLCKASLFGDEEVYDSIKNADTPQECKRLGRRVRNFDNKVWMRNVCEIARAVIISKFSQVPGLKKLLKSTGSKLIAEAAPNDFLWGIGLSSTDPNINIPSKWKGINLLGWALMEARNMI